MTIKEVAQMIDETGLPNAYHHFSKKTAKEPPFICFYYPGDNDFKADNINYGRINLLTIELYTDNKDFELEKNVEAVLMQHDMVFAKSEAFISSQKMYMTTYEMEVIINGE